MAALVLLPAGTLRADPLNAKDLIVLIKNTSGET